MKYVNRIVAWFYNPKDVRDKNGVVINDFKRRSHSKKLNKEIKNGKINLIKKIGGTRCHKVSINSEVIGLKSNLK